jgi:hypothetical protein
VRERSEKVCPVPESEAEKEEKKERKERKAVQRDSFNLI